MKHNLISTTPMGGSGGGPEGFSGCSHGPMPAARRSASAPPIFVNGVPIPEAAIAEEAQHHSAGSGPEARAAAARALVIRELLLQRANAIGLKPEPVRDAAGRQETDEEALVRQLIEREAPAQEPSEAECRRVYESSQHMFEVPDLYEASHILLAPQQADEGAWREAQAQARRLITEIESGADFAALARAFSVCPSAADGGSLGQCRVGDLAYEIEQALLALEPGSVAASPIKTRHGWHVVRLERRAPAQIAPFEQVRAAISAALHARASVSASARYVHDLAAEADIEGLRLEFGAS